MKPFEWNFSTTHAYALGYWEGRVNTRDMLEANPYEDSDARWAFNMGYSRGEADHCEDKQIAA